MDMKYEYEITAGQENYILKKVTFFYLFINYIRYDFVNIVSL